MWYGRGACQKELFRIGKIATGEYTILSDVYGDNRSNQPISRWVLTKTPCEQFGLSYWLFFSYSNSYSYFYFSVSLYSYSLTDW